MSLHVPITEDLVSILDRVLDKGIVVESMVCISLYGVDLIGIDLMAPAARARIADCSVYVGYGDQGSWKEHKELEKLFPFWRRELWTK